LFGNFFRGANVENPGIVDQGVEISKLPGGFAENAVDVALLGDICCQHQWRAAGFFRDGIEEVLAPAYQGDLRALVNKCKRNGAADPGTRAGDDCSLVLQTRHAD
jgi:hypothetical protein